MDTNRTQNANAHTSLRAIIPPQDPEEALKKRFLEIDKNGDGFLTKEEYKNWQYTSYQNAHPGQQIPDQRLDMNTQTLWKAASSTKDSLDLEGFRKAIFSLDNSSYTSIIKHAGIQMIFNEAGIKIDDITSEGKFIEKLAEALYKITNKEITRDRLEALNELIKALESGNTPPGYERDGKTQSLYIKNWWTTAGGSITPPNN